MAAAAAAQPPVVAETVTEGGIAGCRKITFSAPFTIWLLSVSIKTTQPVVQSVPMAGIISTLRPLFIASLRVKVTADRKSFEVDVSRYFEVKSLKLGTAIMSMMAIKRTTTISSIRVNPFCGVLRMCLPVRYQQPVLAVEDELGVDVGGVPSLYIVIVPQSGSDCTAVAVTFTHCRAVAPQSDA